MKLSMLSLLIMLGAAACAVAQNKPTTAPVAPAVLPGKGLAEHDFFYAGESRERKMFIVKNGQIARSYDDPAGKGEISDAVVLSNGNILFAHQFAVKLITPEKKVLWNYDVPKGCEVHTALPIGKWNSQQAETVPLGKSARWPSVGTPQKSLLSAREKYVRSLSR